MTKRKVIVVAAIGFAAASVFGVTALATPGSGVTPTDTAKGTLAGHVQVNADRIKFQTKGDTDIVVQKRPLGAMPGLMS